MKHRCLIGGVPSLIPPDEIKKMDGNLIKRARSYFGKWYCKEPYFTIESACYIDNYIALSKFVDDDEEKRAMAWEFTQNTMDLSPMILRPDKLYSEKPKEADSTMILKMNKVLHRFSDGWCGMRYVMVLERYMEWNLPRFYDEVIVPYGIEHEVGRTFKGNNLVYINLIDFCEKYYCKKYDIPIEKLDI